MFLSPEAPVLIARSSEQEAASLSPWWPWVQPPPWMTSFGLTLSQTLNPGTGRQGAASISRASAPGRVAICAQRDVRSCDSSDDGAFSCPVLSTLQVVAGAHSGACAQGHTPASWQMQESRAGCPQRCPGCGQGK